MSTSVISPEFKVIIFQPNNDKPIEFPVDKITNIRSVRGLRNNSITITFARNSDPNINYRDYFQDQSLVSLQVRINSREPFVQENFGYVTGNQTNILPNRKNETINILGLEAKLKNQNLFLDVIANQDYSIEDINLKALKADGNKFVHTLSSIGKVFDKINEMPRLIKAVYDTFIADLSNPNIDFEFGGKELFKKTSDLEDDPYLILPFILAEGYTKTFTHVFNFVSGYTIGANVNFWDIINSLECDPLYEVFFDSLERTYYDNSTILDSNGIGTTYEVEREKVSFIFRKTPFEKYIDSQGQWKRDRVIRQLPKSKIKSIVNSFSQDSIYAGVHVGLSFLGQQASTIVQPPIWNQNIKSIFGYRLMRVMLDGLQFEDNVTLANIKKTFQGEIKTIQDRLFSIFCNFPKVKAANSTIETKYDFFRVGTPLQFDNPEKDFGDIGYIESVSSSFAPQGHATSTIELKWVDYDLKTQFSKQTVSSVNISDASFNQTSSLA